MSVTMLLKSRWTGTLMMGLLTLSVAILAALLLPGRAEAQQEQAATNTTTVVGAGESLWTIAQARLAPDASPQQVATETERIYGLNRERIGDDPNLIFPGQELLLTRGPEPTAVAVAPPTEFATTPAEVPTATSEQPMVAGAAPGQKDEPTPGPLIPAPAQEIAAEGPTSSATDVEPSSSEPLYADRRRPDKLTLLLSAGFFLFSLSVAVFGVSKLLSRRRLLGERYEPSTMIRQDRSGHPGGTYDQPQRSERDAGEPQAGIPVREPFDEGRERSAAKPIPGRERG